MNTLIMPAIAVIAMIVLFTFSNKQRAKMQEEQKNKMNNLKIGTRILTYSGIVATVEQIGDTYLQVNTGDSKLIMSKDAIVKFIEEEIEFSLPTNENTSSLVKLEVMLPNNKNSKREEYGF